MLGAATALALLYATYLGGNGDDTATGIAVDGSGHAFVVGGTISTDLPQVNPVPGVIAPFFTNSRGFVAAVSPDGAALPFATYLGGTFNDSATAVAVDLHGNLFVAGWTFSTNFPTVLPFQSTHGGGQQDAFLTEISAAFFTPAVPTLGPGGVTILVFVLLMVGVGERRVRRRRRRTTER